jgi:hypothetical protein
MSKGPRFNPAAAAVDGSVQRKEEHLPRARDFEGGATLARKTPGRKKTFPVPTDRLNVILPMDLARKIKASAMTEGKTVSEFVAQLATEAFDRREST